MGRKRTNTRSSSRTTTRLDASSRSRINTINARADERLSQPFQQFVPGLSNFEQQARTQAQNVQGQFSGLFDESADQLRGAASFTPDAVSFNRDVDVDRYINPFESQVVDALNADFDYSEDRSRNDIAARAALDGGYGGSGQAIAEAELAGQTARARGTTLGNLRFSNYQNALALDQQDRANEFAADQFNVNAGLQNAAQDASIAQALAGLADRKQEHAFRDIGLLDSLGANERAIEQAQGAAEYQDLWNRLQQDNIERQLAGSLADRTGTSNSQSQTVQRAPLASTIGSAFGLAGSIIPGIGGISSSIGNLFGRPGGV